MTFADFCYSVLGFPPGVLDMMIVALGLYCGIILYFCRRQ